MKFSYITNVAKPKESHQGQTKLLILQSVKSISNYVNSKTSYYLLNLVEICDND